MKLKNLYAMPGLLVVLSMVLTACQPATTDNPVTTEVPATDAPAAEPAAAATDRRGGWLDEIDVSVVAGDSAISQLQAGAIDLYSYGLASDVYPAIREAGLGYSQSYGGSYSTMLNPAVFTDAGVMNPFSNRKIREALNWLIDRNYINQEIYAGGSLPKFPHTLSGGQQQRIVIARAMIREPKLIVADEPVSMLDASVRVEILKLLRALQESHHLSVIYITHDLSTVKYFSVRIFVMYAGNLVEKAATRHLLENPLHPYTRALLAATSDPDARNADTFKEVPPGEPPSLVKPPTGCRFHPRCAHAMPGLCDQAEPPDFEPEPDHFVACWLYQ
jgi:oligopeptide/dipeptide ABC transporter ATP-binding protein